MAIGALTPPADPVSETLLEFPDNFLLIDLCGEYDRNLTTIEESLGVPIAGKKRLEDGVGPDYLKRGVGGEHDPSRVFA